MPITALKGTVDILPTETTRWRQVEDVAHRVANLFGYKEIRTPAFEASELFVQALGDDSDVIEKELYTFRDKSGRSLTLRPEMTIPTVRAYLEHNLGSSAQLKSYYLSEIWRYERPQAGRTHEAHQFGVEAIGSASPAVDAELVDLAMTFFRELGLKDLRLEVNTIGCRKCRPTYQAALKDFFLGKDDVLCQDCERRKETNALRVLDCKKDTCIAVTNTAPTVFQSLCSECRTHFFTFKEHLSQMGYPVFGNPRVVQGLGYYSRTVFQIHSTHLGPHNPLCSGGRFDELVSHLGSSGTPAIGFAVGLERTIAALEKEAVLPPAEPRVDAFFVGIGEEAERIMTRTIHQLRRRGYRAERDYMARGLKNQLKLGEKLNPTYTVVVGEEDTRVAQVVVQDNLRGSSENVSAGRLVDAIEYRLRRDAREASQKRPSRDERAREERGRDRGRRREEPRGERRERLGREELPREEGEEGARFAEWAATYAEAARSAPPRPHRRTPVSELVAQPPGEGVGYETWAAAQSGLAEAPSGHAGPWPARPVTYAGEMPPRRPAPMVAQNVGGNWLDDGGSRFARPGGAEPSPEEEAVFAPDAGYDSPGLRREELQASVDGDLDDDDGDDGDDDGESDELATAAAGGDGENGDKRRRSRRGGRRHGRRRTRGGRG